MLKLAAIFVTVFLAELGDKTQLATVLFATDKQHSPLLVFMAAASALVLSTGLAVALGTWGGKYLEMVPLKLIAGSGFILLGAMTVYDHYRGA